MIFASDYFFAAIFFAPLSSHFAADFRLPPLPPARARCAFERRASFDFRSAVVSPRFHYLRFLHFHCFLQMLTLLTLISSVLIIAHCIAT
jgi:hypothetical protein